MTAPAPDRRLRGAASRRAPRRDAAPVHHGLVRFFVVPAAVIASNAAALLCALTIVGLVPGLAGAGRVLRDVGEHQDTAFRSVLRHVRTTLRRDLPVSAGAWMIVGAVLLNGLLLPEVPPSARVFLAGLLVPLLWVMISWVSAYVCLAADAGSSRADVTLGAVRLCVTRPLRALAAPAVIIALSPLWLLAPLTIACGLSVPPYLLATVWRGPDAEQDPPPTVSADEGPA